MALSWNEIKDRALKFSNEFKDARYEKGETQTFYNEFFNVFGLNRRRVATFEEPVKKLGDKQGFIDLFWKGVLLVEQKSQGRDLKKAKTQALDYFPNLKDEELPRYILLSDFQTFELYDLETGEENKFDLKDLYQNVGSFGFIAGYEKKSYKDTEVVNIEASELMGKLYDELKESGYPEHDLELFLTRVLFCLFADDSDIWEKDILTQYISERTAEDGSDLGLKLAHLFQVLNTPDDKRSSNLDEHLKRFAYINGGLFAKTVFIPDFNSKMRKVFLDCCHYNWAKVSPAIFGSLFQSVSNPQKRRELGEHYTSEQNILKLIEPLFLDELWEEFEKIKPAKQKKKDKLEEFHAKLASLRFFDPACGCGNFLVVTYRELRRLENQVILALEKIKKSNIDGIQMKVDTTSFSKLDVDNFYGIEIEEFPCKIAEVALWMTDHLMNMELSEALGMFYSRIPLVKSAKIVNANSLTINWHEIVRPEALNYILGNPPFVGSRTMSIAQKKELINIFGNIKNVENLDYVTTWYLKSAQYIKNYAHIKCAFVSTNSITQGEQVSILWKELVEKYNIFIHFAHRTFDWCNEARGNAHVHCVIIGFTNFYTNKKRLFDYEDIKSEPHEIEVKNINPYLIEGDTIFIEPQKNPIFSNSFMKFGNQPRDGGNFVLTEEEKNEIIKQEPEIEKFIKLYMGAEEFINNKKRYCIWLYNVSPNEINKSKILKQRIQKVFQFRSSSRAKTTNQYAKVPSIFAQIAQPNSDYIIIPRVSSEKRLYVPIGFINKEIIASDAVQIIPNGTMFDFGILTSIMHMTWMKYTCGRLKSDYRYSKDICYNNFPFPKDLSSNNNKNVEEKVQAVLDVRAKYQNADKECSLAVLYNPETMPPDLMKTHQELDRAVDKCYGKTSFNSERERIEFLFALYEQYTKPLLSNMK